MYVAFFEINLKLVDYDEKNQQRPKIDLYVKAYWNSPTVSAFCGYVKTSPNRNVPKPKRPQIGKTSSLKK